MPLEFIKEKDFVKAPFSLAIGVDDIDGFRDVISEARQKHWLAVLLGAKESAKFVADIEANGGRDPSAAIYTKILNGFSFESRDEIIFFGGLRRALVHAFFHEWSSIQPVINTTSGNKTLVNIASDYSAITKGAQVWNNLVYENASLAAFMALDTVDNPSTTDYPDYKFQQIPFETTI
jgi:hypothetical protein